MRTRRRHQFAAPVVMTVALGPACGTPAGRLPATGPGPLSVPVVPPPPPRDPPERPEPPPFTIGSIVFRDPICYRVTGDDPTAWTAESCTPDLLPPAPDDRAVILDHWGPEDVPWCFVVGPRPEKSEDWDKGRVRCPDSGPQVILPDPDFTRSPVRISLDHRTLTCGREVMANPPYLEPIDHCPSDLLPWLADGLEPTRNDDGTCTWRGVEVACVHVPATPHGPPPPDHLDGHVVEVATQGGRLVATIDLGIDDGVDRYWTGQLFDAHDRVLASFVLVRVARKQSFAVIARVVFAAAVNARVRLRPPAPPP